MVLVHDDDLARLDGVCDSIVGRSSIQYAVVLIFSYFQPLDSLQSIVTLRHMRGLRPTAHIARIGELFQCHGVTISTTNSGGAHLKICRPVWKQNPLAWLHFQTFFKSEVKFHGFLSSFLAHIASDSSVIDILDTSKFPRRYP
jgi:hypothetical protein